MEEEETNLGAGGSTPATNVGGEDATPSQPGAGAPSADQEDIDTVIGEVAMDAEAKANKITAEEAAKGAAEGTTKEPAGEAGKAAVEEGAAEADLEERIAEAQAWFCQAHEELKVAQDLLAERKLELVMKQDDIEKAQDEARAQAAKDEAARHQPQAELNSCEEDLAAREEKLVATLCGKDEEIGKLVAQRTQELEQKHKEALDAQALVHAGKVKELEVERDRLKEQALKVAEEKDTLNGALVEAQGAVLGKAEELSRANDSIKDLKLKLEDKE
nr:tol-Pal system protein TolA-like [Aegilops tauschii subsp. strangulata]